METDSGVVRLDRLHAHPRRTTEHRANRRRRRRDGPDGGRSGRPIRHGPDHALGEEARRRAHHDGGSGRRLPSRRHRGPWRGPGHRRSVRHSRRRATSVGADLVSFHQPLPGPLDPFAAARDTDAWWRDWSERCTYRGPWREAVGTSLRVLKALTFGPTGGIVAAPTTSLPEWPGAPATGTIATAGFVTPP